MFKRKHVLCGQVMRKTVYITFRFRKNSSIKYSLSRLPFIFFFEIRKCGDVGEGFKNKKVELRNKVTC